MSAFSIWVLVFFVVLIIALGIFPEKSCAETGAEMTKRYEGFRSRPYKDTTGNWTIGYGFKITEAQACLMATAGISQEHADEIFEEKYSEARKIAKEYCGHAVYWKLNQMQRNILTDMAYNLGAGGLSKFANMRNAIQDGDYEQAAWEMKNSLWYRQVGNRAKHHVANFAEEV